MSERMGMHCPGCNQIASLSFAEQAFCSNTECRVLTWNPTLTLQQLVDNVEFFEPPDPPDWLRGDPR